MAYIKMYFAQGDVQVSEAPTTTNAVEFTLRADLNEDDEVRLYVKSDDGYVCSGVEIIPSGTTAAKWALAQDDGGSPDVYGTYGSGLSIAGNVLDSSGSYFWAKAKATDDEDPVNDTSVTLNVTGIAAAI